MLRSLLTKDLSWKIFSVAIAVAIYVTVKTASRDTVGGTKTLEVSGTLTLVNQPVIILSSAADVREFKVNPSFVQVAVRGEPELLKTLSEKDVHVTVDLTDITEDRDLRKRVNVSAPPGVTLVRVAPPTVEVVIPPKSGR